MLWRLAWRYFGFLFLVHFDRDEMEIGTFVSDLLVVVFWEHGEDAFGGQRVVEVEPL